MLKILKKNSKKDDIEKIYNLLCRVEDFMDRELNSISYDEDGVENKDLDKLYQKVIEISQKMSEKTKNDLGVNGEMLILIEKMSDGDFSDKVSLTTDDPYLNYFAKSLNSATSKLHKNFLEILNILKEYESGVYLKSLSTKDFRDGEIKMLIEGIDSLKASITDILKDNYKYGYILKENSITLNEKMQKIVSSSDSQAEKLQEVSEHISRLKEQADITNLDAKQMQNSSSTIKQSANQGLTYANDTVSAMNEINIATQDISEAIDVIEQIAFQTNILSLNAAVEAATAGEAGKGFAVVASEVRNLASRSTDAAQKIKELVEKATDKANDGKEISDSMIDGYKNLIDHIDVTADLVNKTTIATSKQLDALSTIDATIVNLKTETKNYADIAHQTNEVGLNLNQISNKILNITEKTEFEGKKLISKKVDTPMLETV